MTTIVPRNGAGVRPRTVQSIAAEAAFRSRMEELGATLLEERWLGARALHGVRCAAGHENRVTPNRVQQGGGICRTCAGNDPNAAEAAFRACVEELGGVVLEPSWLGNKKPHRIKCAEGHDCSPMPTSVQRGQGICRVCAGKDPVTAESAFRARLEEFGAVLLEERWLGKGKPHRVRCAAGHECSPRPTSVQQGGGICRVCAGKGPGSSKLAEAAFRSRVKDLGGTVIEPKWLGHNKPHRVRCAAGHECRTYPTGVQQGVGICRRCMGKAWDAFYVVVDKVNGHLKFGITSGGPHRRLGAHARDGFDTVLRLATSLPDDVAPTLERQILAALRDAGEQPVRGREYFPLRVQALVLDLVDNHPAVR